MNSPVKVSVLIPCRNESGSIEACVRNVYSFQPPVGGFEVIVIDGMSNDGTREILRRLVQEFPGLVIIDNPKRTVPYAMNLGIKEAKGEFIIRTDVRCVHPKNYVVDLVELSEKTRADNVGGVLEPAGNTFMQKAIAVSYRSPVSMGGALRHRSDFVGETDAVYGGCFQRNRLIEIGMYDEGMTRNQDDELSFRLRKNGGKIMQTSKIRVLYYPRKSLGQLFKQFCQYGFWKVRVIQKHPQQAAPRHLCPSALVCILGFLLVGEIWSTVLFWTFWCVLLAYIAAVTVEAVRVSAVTKSPPGLIPAVAASIGTIHTSYGIGFICGLLFWGLGIKAKWFESLSR
jgi:succinoglycan biosynthesis protein ExoA